MGKYLIEPYDYVKCILLMHKRGANDFFFVFATTAKSVNSRKFISQLRAKNTNKTIAPPELWNSISQCYVNVLFGAT